MGSSPVQNNWTGEQWNFGGRDIKGEEWYNMWITVKSQAQIQWNHIQNFYYKYKTCITMIKVKKWYKYRYKTHQIKWDFGGRHRINIFSCIADNLDVVKSLKWEETGIAWGGVRIAQSSGNWKWEIQI